jgi:hypothetical protein
MFLQVCPVCEHRNPRGSRFCNDCGSPLQLRFCPRCHAAEDVMSLECRSCGERLPMVVLTDSTIDPDQSVPATGVTWEPQPPQPAPFQPRFEKDSTSPSNLLGPDLAADDGPTTVLDTGAPFPANGASSPLLNGEDGEDGESTRPFVDLDPESPRITATAKAAETEAPRLAPSIDLAAAMPAVPTPAPRAPSLIERLNAANPAFDFVAKAVPSAGSLAGAPAQATAGEVQRVPEIAAFQMTPAIDSAPQTAAPASDSAQLPDNGPSAPAAAAVGTAASQTPLQEESEAEIAVSEEAETLVEASVAPLTYEPPAEITVDDTQIGDIADQLRSGAWRHALPGDAPLPPVVIQVEPPSRRRLDFRRVGLAVGSVGAIAAALLFVRLSPGGSAAPPKADGTTSAVSAVAQPAAAPESTSVRKPAPAGAAITVAATPPTAAASTPRTPATAAPSTPADATSPAPATGTTPTPANEPSPTPAHEPSPTPSNAASPTPAATALPTPAAAATDAASSAAPNGGASAAHTETAAPAPQGLAAASPAEIRPQETKAPATVARRPPAARPVAEAATTPTGARRAATTEPQRACTPAIAALGLCTLETGEETH